MDVISLAIANRARNLGLQSPRSVNSQHSGRWPNHFEIIDPCNDPSDWVVSEGSTATAVDRLEFNNLLPEWSDAADIINPYPLNGTSMIKVEGPPGTISRELDPISLADDEVLGVWMFIDSISTDTSIWSEQPAPTLQFVSDYPNNSQYIRRRMRPPSGRMRRSGVWTLLYFPPMNKNHWNISAGFDRNAINGVTIGFEGTANPNWVRWYLGPLIRMKNPAKRGAIIIEFDDGLKSYYEEAFRYMTGVYGYRGCLFMVGKAVEEGHYPLGSPSPLPTMTVKQMQRMQEAGWDVGSHTWEHPSGDTYGHLATLSYDEQERQIRRNVEWLWENGITFGSRIFAAPQHSLNYRTLDILQRYHPIVRSGINASGMLPIPTLYSFRQVYEIRDSFPESEFRQRLQEAQDHKLVTSFLFHNIGDAGYDYTTIERFEYLIDIIGEYDVDVITYSDILDGRWPADE